MPTPAGKRRSIVTTLFAVIAVAVALVVFAMMRLGSFFRPKYVPIGQLKFPVLVMQPDGASLFAEWDSTALQKFPERSSRTPVNGTIIIDSAFNQFTQENVHRQTEGELKWIARALVPGLRVKYTFDLRRASASGRDALHAIIRKATPFSDDPTEDAAMRAAAQQHSTMDGVLEALHFYKPAEPATPLVSEQMDSTPSTSPIMELEPGRDNPDDPGPPN